MNLYDRFPNVPREILDEIGYGDFYEVFNNVYGDMGGLSGTTNFEWYIGPGNTSTDIYIRANLGGPNDPKLRYNKTTQKWQFSNDGTTWQDFGTGGSGVGISGYSGFSGWSGVSGYSGLDGTASASGYSGYSGVSGTSIIYTTSSGVSPNLLERTVYLDPQSQEWILSTVIS